MQISKSTAIIVILISILLLIFSTIVFKQNNYYRQVNDELYQEKVFYEQRFQDKDTISLEDALLCLWKFDSLGCQGIRVNIFDDIIDNGIIYPGMESSEFLNKMGSPNKKNDSMLLYFIDGVCNDSNNIQILYKENPGTYILFYIVNGTIPNIPGIIIA